MVVPTSVTTNGSRYSTSRRATASMAVFADSQHTCTAHNVMLLQPDIQFHAHTSQRTLASLSASVSARYCSNTRFRSSFERFRKSLSLMRFWCTTNQPKAANTSQFHWEFVRGPQPARTPRTSVCFGHERFTRSVSQDFAVGKQQLRKQVPECLCGCSNSYIQWRHLQAQGRCDTCASMHASATQMQCVHAPKWACRIRQAAGLL